MDHLEKTSHQVDIRSIDNMDNPKSEIPVDDVWEDSEADVHQEPAQNAFEKAKWNSNGYDQSGMR